MNLLQFLSLRSTSCTILKKLTNVHEILRLYLISISALEIHTCHTLSTVQHELKTFPKNKNRVPNIPKFPIIFFLLSNQKSKTKVHFLSTKFPENSDKLSLLISHELILQILTSSTTQYLFKTLPKNKNLAQTVTKFPIIFFCQPNEKSNYPQNSLKILRNYPF